VSRWSPCKRQEFIRKLRALGFEDPVSGARHQFMVRGPQRLTIPTNAEFSVPQLRFMLREVEALLGRSIALTEWEKL